MEQINPKATVALHRQKVAIFLPREIDRRVEFAMFRDQKTKNQIGNEAFEMWLASNEVPLDVNV